MVLTPALTYSQPKISIGLHADPVVSWFSSDISETKNDGARPGFSFGFKFASYFSANYAFSTGISIINAGGRLVSTQPTVLILGKQADKITTVQSNKPVVYKIQYLSVPLGLKLQTNQIGYITFFSDLGLDPKVVIGGKVDIPSLDITGENASSELQNFNLSYHITGGIEYSIGGNTAFVLGLNFENNFLDITKETGTQPSDKVSHKLLSARIGINF
jgi:hypothetical protein